jgi:hypothetical protein
MTFAPYFNLGNICCGEVDAARMYSYQQSIF